MIVSPGNPHSAMVDDIYEDMLIPKGTRLITNIWYYFPREDTPALLLKRAFHRKMLNDERFFQEPEVFQPERFRSKVEAMRDNLQSLNGHMLDDPSALTFGFGRRYAIQLRINVWASLTTPCRICPGRYFADTTVWLVMAQMLAVFDISSPRDKTTGMLELPRVAFITGTVRCVVSVLLVACYQVLRLLPLKGTRSRLNVSSSLAMR